VPGTDLNLSALKLAPKLSQPY